MAWQLRSAQGTFESGVEFCDGCGGENDVRLLRTANASTSLAMCAECRIKVEALLRGARKSGPPIRNWTRP